MKQRGDCLTCARIYECSITTLERVLSSYTCPLFDAVPSPTYEARVRLMEMFGDEGAVAAMMMKPTTEQEE